MKMICLDTETTGLNPQKDKIIEIGCVDITNGISNKKNFHTYINPGIHIPSFTTKIHGITDEKVKHYLPFKEYAQDFLSFIKNATLIIHNAKFDLNFLNAELARCNLPELQNPYIDTVQIARIKFPGQKANLDTLMKKFKITIERNIHGALLDAEILAQVYLALINNQESLDLTIKKDTKDNINIKEKKITISSTEETLNANFFSK